MSQTSLQSAIQVHQAGHLEQAEGMYRQILATDPANPKATDLLGVIFAQRRQFAQAAGLFQQAIALQPNVAEFYQHLGQAMIDMKRGNDAVACFRQVVALQPNNHFAFFRLGTLLVTSGQLGMGIESLKSAVALQPNTLDYRGALATAYMQVNRADLAAIEMREGTRIAPDNVLFWHNLGAALAESGKVAEGLEALQKAIKLDSSRGATHCNIAGALRQLGRHDEAMVSIRRAIEIDPACPGVQNNLGALLADEGNLEGTLEAWRLAVAHDPASPGTHWNYARILLQLGHFAEGWEEFEWRLKYPGMRLNRGFPQPQWDGSDPVGKTILLHAEGGFGDALNFVRLVPQVTARGGRWILECQPELTRLLEGTPGVESIIARGQALPAFDLQIPLQGLPRVVGIRLDNIPNKVPYLHPPADRVKYWADRVAEKAGLRVGLVWAGSKGQRGDTRSRSVELFAPLAAVEGVRFFSLQKGADFDQTSPAGMDWTDYTSELPDFAEMAALVQNLDLVISVDTSTAHLAGALSRPVWVVIPYQCDFRWLSNRADSPWYPTMRLFREPVAGESAAAVAEMVTALRGFKS